MKCWSSDSLHNESSQNECAWTSLVAHLSHSLALFEILPWSPAGTEEHWEDVLITGLNHWTDKWASVLSRFHCTPDSHPLPISLWLNQHRDPPKDAIRLRNGSPREPLNICLMSFEIDSAWGTMDWETGVSTWRATLVGPLSLSCIPGTGQRACWRDERIERDTDCSHVPCWDDLWGLGQLCVHESLRLSLVLAPVTEQMDSQSKDILLDSSPAWPHPIGQPDLSWHRLPGPGDGRQGTGIGDCPLLICCSFIQKLSVSTQ